MNLSETQDKIKAISSFKYVKGDNGVIAVTYSTAVNNKALDAILSDIKNEKVKDCSFHISNLFYSIYFTKDFIKELIVHRIKSSDYSNVILKEMQCDIYITEDCIKEILEDLNHGKVDYAVLLPQ